MNQLRQHGLALIGYTEDWEEALPNRRWGDSWTWHYRQDENHGEYSLLVELEYLMPELRVCPSSWWNIDRKYSYDGSSYSAYLSSPTQCGTYYYYGGGFQRDESPSNPSPAAFQFNVRFQTQMIQDSAAYLMTGDWVAPLQANSKRDAYDGGNWVTWDNYKYNNHDAWGEPTGGNHLYADGHVEWAAIANFTCVSAGRFHWTPRNTNYVWSSSYYYIMNGVFYGSYTPTDRPQFKRIFSGGK
jgi:prepilin-type processing-associated H-X9-DG protein